MIKQILFIFLAGTLAVGQGARRDDAALGNNGSPVPFPTVRICTEGATGVPCSPLASTFTDKTLATGASNPSVGDAFGNFFFYAAPGWYQVQVSGAGVSPYTFVVLLPPDVANATFTNLTVSGSFNITGSFSAAAFSSTASTPAAAGFIRASAGDAVCWRNAGNTADVCLSKNGSDQIVGASSSTPIISTTANPAASGSLRLAKTDTIAFRNNANSADVSLSLNGSDQIVGVAASSPFISASANPSATGVLRLNATDLLCWRNQANTGDVCFGNGADDIFDIPGGVNINNGPIMTNPPVMTWSMFNSSTYTGVASFGTFQTTKPIQIRRFDVWNSTIGVGCATQPVVDISDGTNSYMATTVANTVQQNSSTSGAPINIAAGVNLRFRIITAAAGCSTNPAGPQFTAQYNMQ